MKEQDLIKIELKILEEIEKLENNQKAAKLAEDYDKENSIFYELQGLRTALIIVCEENTKIMEREKTCTTSKN